MLYATILRFSIKTPSRTNVFAKSQIQKRKQAREREREAGRGRERWGASVIEHRRRRRAQMMATASAPSIRKTFVLTIVSFYIECGKCILHYLILSKVQKDLVFWKNQPTEKVSKRCLLFFFRILWGISVVVVIFCASSFRSLGVRAAEYYWQTGGYMYHSSAYIFWSTSCP